MQVSTRSQGLDLIRAFAVIAVVLSHTSVLAFRNSSAPSWVNPIGAVGVDLFYALSGYLIGRILLGLVDTPTPDVWLRFMARRWSRTLPLYFAVLSFAVLLACPDIREILRFSFMTQNLISPVDHTAFGSFLGISWSLTVEEFFYLTFATSLLVSASIFGRRAVWPTIIAFLVVPLVIRCLMYGQPGAYYVAIGNVDGIGWGVVLAMLQRQGSSLFTKPVTCLVVGISLVAVAWVPYAIGAVSFFTEWHPGSLTVSAAGCAMIVAAALNVGNLGIVGPLVRAVSARSYSIYLTHWLVLSAVSANHSMTLPVSIAVFLTITAAVSYCTHRWIEMPGMKIRMPVLVRTSRMTAPEGVTA